MLRSIHRFVDLSGIRKHLKPFYIEMGRPSVGPELIRMVIMGYCMMIRSERRFCDEVHLNLAYHWFCKLGLEGDVPDHSTFPKNRHGRFRDSDLLRKLFETTVKRRIAEGLSTWIIPEITRRSSTRRAPGCFFGKCGSITVHASSDDQDNAIFASIVTQSVN